MQSTIDKRTPAPGSEREKQDAFERGIRILHDLISHVSRPKNWAEERLALRAIASLKPTLGGQRHFPESSDALIEDMGSVCRGEVTALVRWLHPTPLKQTRLYGLKSRAGLRHLLLVILLAKQIAPVFRFPIAQELSALGFWPEREECHLLLNWLPRWYASKAQQVTARLYIEATLDVWYTPTFRPAFAQVDETLRQFVQWPVNRQLLELLAWHREWDRETDIGAREVSILPTMTIRSVEFQLSRRRMFREIISLAGPVGGRLIANTGYDDREDSKIRRFPWGAMSVAISLLAVATILVAVRRHQINDWHEENMKLLQDYEGYLRERLQATDDWQRSIGSDEESAESIESGE